MEIASLSTPAILFLFLIKRQFTSAEYYEYYEYIDQVSIFFFYLGGIIGNIVILYLESLSKILLLQDDSNHVLSDVLMFYRL